MPDNTLVGVYANVRATPPMPQDDVVEDLLTLLSFAPAWVALNEAAKVRRYRRAIRRLFDSEDWRYVALSRRKRNAVLVRRTTLRVNAHRVVRLCRGLPGVNPARRATIVQVQHRDSGHRFWLVCTHLPNGKDNPRKRARAWRTRAWDTAMRRLCQVLLDLDATGLPIILVGDLNDRHTPDLLRQGWRWFSANGRIVKCGGTARGTHTRLVSGLATDHPGLIVRTPL